MMDEKTREKLTAIQARHADSLMRKANVVGVGIGYKNEQAALVVMVAKKVALADLAPEDVVPTEIEGVPVDVRETGMFTAQ